jgi:hypothetical protein
MGLGSCHVLNISQAGGQRFMSPGAGPLSQLGVTGDLSSLLNSPTQAKAVPSDEADDDVRFDVLRRVCAS